MTSKSKRKKIDHRTSRAVTIPRELDKGTGDYVTLAYDRIIIIDPKAEIDEGKLSEFLELIQPDFWKWYSQNSKSNEMNENERKSE